MIGREVELDLISSRIDGLAAGRPFVLTVRGEPGSGRTALLEAARRRGEAVPAQVLGARGVDGDRDPAFAGLSGLLRPLAPRFADLAGPLAGPLGDAVALAPTSLDPDQVRRGALAALTQVAAASPLLLLLDDADRLDRPTLDLLDFVLGRLGTDPIGAVAVTGIGPGPLDAVTTDVLPVAGLSRSALADLVRATVPCAPGVALALADLAEGSPLLAVELARSLTADERDGTTPLPDAPRPTVLMVDRLQRELDLLPPEVQRALVVVAADRTGSVGVVVKALAALGDPPGALDQAEATSLIGVSGSTVRFRHGLIRPLAYRLVAAASRRAAHRALAAALDEPHQAAERAWQLVASCAGPDPAVAEMLDLVAAAEHRRGSPSGAAEALEQAARLSDGPEERGRRLVAAAAARLDADDADRARDLALGAAEAGHPDAPALLARLTGGAEPPDPLAATLSNAELRVAEAVASGLTNRQAAEQLFVSAKTVDFHLQSIYRKLAIRSRAELATLVATRGRRP